jgi:hypothetical protein
LVAGVLGSVAGAGLLGYAFKKSRDIGVNNAKKMAKLKSKKKKVPVEINSG